MKTKMPTPKGFESYAQFLCCQRLSRGYGLTIYQARDKYSQYLNPLDSVIDLNDTEWSFLVGFVQCQAGETLPINELLD